MLGMLLVSPTGGSAAVLVAPRRGPAARGAVGGV